MQFSPAQTATRSHLPGKLICAPTAANAFHLHIARRACLGGAALGVLLLGCYFLLCLICVFGAPPPANNPAPIRLSYWRFNNPNWLGEQGESPLGVVNVTNAPSFDGNGLLVNNPGGVAFLKYSVIEPSGKTNLDVRCGTIRFMFQPAWTSPVFGGGGPGQLVRLWELGNPDLPGGGMALSIDVDGRSIIFASEDNSGSPAYKTVATYDGFAANSWYEFVLTFSTPPRSPANRVRLWINTAPVMIVDSIPSLPLPPPSVQANGFTMGSSSDGTHQSQGLLDEWEIFNYELGEVGSRMISGLMSAQVATQPPKISLQWRRVPDAAATLQRKSPTAATWTTLANTLAWSYNDTDPSLVVGQRYQYQLLFTNSPLVEGIVSAGLNLPPVENRGSVVLLVDQTVAPDLAPDLAQLQQDLVGDGWTVLRHDVPRHDDRGWFLTATNQGYIQNVAGIKSLIVNDYHTATNPVKAVFIVGHVSIPYSGAAAEDGHSSTPDDPGNHFGAWPADGYYGDMNGPWPDQSVNYINPFNPVLQNLPGDGKFDPNTFPAPLAVAVGRIDFAKMPAFTNQPPARTETDLLRQYLAKEHRYRHGEIALPNSSLVAGFFSGVASSQNQAIDDNAVINGGSWFGLVPGTVLPADLFVDGIQSLWGFQGGFGINNALNAGTAVEHSTSQLTDPAKEPPIAFYMLKGSIFGDWNFADNNLMKATLATPTYGLVAVYTLNTRWRFGELALGDTFGDGFLRTANDPLQRPSARITYLLGDPTLRMGILASVSNLVARSDGAGNVLLNWGGTATNAAYLVYRSFQTNVTSAADFIRLTPVPLAANSFTDVAPPAGTKIYQVRVSSLTTTGSGAYTNLSQGQFTTLGLVQPYGVVAWGSDESGQADVPVGVSQGTVGIAGGLRHSLACKQDGTVQAWGKDDYGQIEGPEGLSNVVTVAAGGLHSLALLSDGTIAAWGNNAQNQCNVPAALNNAVGIAAGQSHSVAVRADGTVVAWGDNSLGQSDVPVGLTNVVAVAAGAWHTLALKADGTVAAWGFDGQGQCDVPTGLAGVAGIAAGGFQSIALKGDGTVTAWGWDLFKQIDVPPGLNNVVQVAMGSQHSVALKADGTVVAWGDNSHSQLGVPVGLGNGVAIAAGAFHTLVLTGQGMPALQVAGPTGFVAVGGAATLRVVGAGTLPFQFQWQFAGQVLPGATNAWLALYNIQASQFGQYTVVAKNAAGATASASTTLFGAGSALSWPTPASIIYGTPLSAAQLNATAGVPGVFTYNPPAGTVLGAGTNTLSVVFTPSDTAHFPPASATVQLVVAKAPLTILAENKVRAVGQPNPDLTAEYTGFVNGETPAVLATPALLTTTATPDSPPGNYPIAVSGATAANYDIAFVNGTLTVAAVAVTINWPPPGPIVYGTPLSGGQLNATASVPGSFDYRPPAGSVLPAGTNTLTVVFTPTDTVNFPPATATVPLVVAKAPLTISADDKTRLFNQPNPELTAQYSGFVNGDTPSVLSAPAVLATTATQSSPAGTYPITVSGAVAANYAITFVNGTLTVTVGPDLIGWPSPLPIVYGTPLTSAQLNAFAAVPGTFAYTPPAGTVLGAGSYSLEAQFTPTDSAHYPQATATVSLVVAKAPLTITADNQARSPDQPNPELTATYHGFVNGDTPAVLATPPVLATTAAQDSPVGSYPITVSGATAANYDISFVNGTLTITAGTYGVVAWGANDYGQLNVPPDAGGGILAVSGGWRHNLALKRQGSVVAWGGDENGQTDVPPGLANVVAVAAGGLHSLALQSNGTVVAWGRNLESQCNVPRGLNNVVAVAAGEAHSVALLAGGTVVAWGGNLFGESTVPPGLSNVVAVAAGFSHTVVLRGDGTVAAWGYDGQGQIDVPSDLSGVMAIAAGGWHNLALKADGTVVAWGWNAFGQAQVPAGLGNVTAVAGGWHHSLAMTDTGQVLAWGDNGQGQLNPPGTLTNVVAIASGAQHSLALTGQQSPEAIRILGPIIPVASANDVSLWAMALGTLPFQYQWQLDGTDIVGATNRFLTITPILPSPVGPFTVTVTNALGAAVSGPTILTVLPP